MRIMIADDEAAIRESLERVLQVEGYDTSTVANGFAVLDGVGGAGGDALDLLILDVMMLLRRRTATDGESQILSFADVRVDPDRFEAWRGGRSLHLTRTEFSLLQVLVRNATRVLTRDVLFEAIWGFDMSATANNLQVYVSYLRRKMEAEGEPRLIYTLRGLGYTLRETPP
ncbi:winged-helix domain-containing protein [Streptomyces sp. MCAF7]